MRINAANDVHFGAGVHDGRVQFHVGAHRYTATAEDALDLGRQLIAAAEMVADESKARHG